MRSLKYVLLPESAAANPMQPGGAAQSTVSRANRNARTQFLFFYAYLVQLLFMWTMTRA